MLSFLQPARAACSASVSSTRSALSRLARPVFTASPSTSLLPLPSAYLPVSSSSPLYLLRSFSASAYAWPRSAVNGEAEAAEAAEAVEAVEAADGFSTPPPPSAPSASAFSRPLSRGGSAPPWPSAASVVSQQARSSSPSPALPASPFAAVSPTAASARPSGERSSSLSLDPESYPMSPSLRRSLRQNFAISAFFPIQAECYSPIAEGKDVIGRSKTGTGKTLAFVLPILERLQRERVYAGRGEVSVLVVEPTRELARQVVGEIEKLSGDVRTLAVYGGSPFSPQAAALMRGVDICVGTPGRLMDHLDRGSCSLRKTLIVVLDEADEMLRRGFKEDIDVILSFANKKQKAQMLLFSATMPDWVKAVCREYQSDAVVVDKVTGEENSTPTRIAHIAMPSPRMLVEKLRIIGQLAREVDGRVILFVNSKSVADMFTSQEYAEELGDGVRARALHGDLTQVRRDRILADFKDGRFKMLVATDIAARGLDIPDVQLVMQLGLPGGNEFYVHRTGRTGRAGKEGKAILLYAANERGDISGLQRDTGVTFQHLAPPRVQGAAYSALTGEPGSVTFHVRLPPSSRLQLDDVLVELEALVHGRIQSEKVEKLQDGLLMDVAQDMADRLLKVLPGRLASGATVSVAHELPTALFGSSEHFLGRLRKMAPAGRQGREASYSSFRSTGGQAREQRRDAYGSRPFNSGDRNDRGGRGGASSRRSEAGQRTGGRDRFGDDRWTAARGSGSDDRLWTQRGEQRRGYDEDSSSSSSSRRVQPSRGKLAGFGSGSG